MKKYAPGGYMTPEDVAEDKASKMSEQAYDKAMPKADTTFGDIDRKRMKQELVAKIKKADDVNRASAAADLASRTNAMGDTYKKGGKVSSASKRADGCAVRGKTKGRII